MIHNALKEQTGKPFERRGTNSVQVKVSKKGDEYLLVQRQIDMYATKSGPQLRSAVVFDAKNGGFNVGVLIQRLVKTKTGKIIFPVKKQDLYIPPNLAGGIALKNGKWQDFVGAWDWHLLRDILMEIRIWKGNVNS
jgi:hypothetical protein